LIADLDQPSNSFSNLYNTILSGLNEAWDDSRASFVTINSVIMAAAFNEHTPKKTLKPVGRTHKARPKDAQWIHRDELPPPPLHWKQLLTHPKMKDFLEACKVEIEQVLKM
jgi:hypothetical protein